MALADNPVQFTQPEAANLPPHPSVDMGRNVFEEFYEEISSKFHDSEEILEYTKTLKTVTAFQAEELLRATITLAYEASLAVGQRQTNPVFDSNVFLAFEKFEKLLGDAIRTPAVTEESPSTTSKPTETTNTTSVDGATTPTTTP